MDQRLRSDTIPSGASRAWASSDALSCGGRLGASWPRISQRWSSSASRCSWSTSCPSANTPATYDLQLGISGSEGHSTRAGQASTHARTPSYGKAASKSVSGRYPRTPARCRRPRLACWRECSSLDSTCDPLPWGLLPGPRALLETSADRTAPPVASVAVHPWGGCLAQFIRLAGSALHAAQARTTDLAWTFVRTASLGRYLHTQTPPRLPDGEPEGHQQRRRNGSVQGRENAHDV